MIRERIYPSKILLIGEYTVILGHPALAIPWERKFAQWNVGSNEEDRVLINFGEFIRNESGLKEYFDLESYSGFISNGGYLESNIPFGYGLGSSGSFCAAVFDKFFLGNKEDHELVFSILKKMECYFHGMSSGLDPVVSYYNTAIQIQNNHISFPELNCTGLFSYFRLKLIDTKAERNTKELIQRFQNSIQDVIYSKKVNHDLVPLNKELIEMLLKNKFHFFIEHWMELSKLSLEVFQEMIPVGIREFWISGIQSKSYYCKLCGAGGGGLFLVYINDELEFKLQLRNYGFEEFR